MTMQSSVDGNISVSSVVLVPEPEDSGALLVCRVETPGLHQILEDSWLLPVHCKYPGTLCFKIFPSQKKIILPSFAALEKREEPVVCPGCCV